VAQYEMNLRDYWLIVRRRRMIIIACTVLVALLSFVLAQRKVPFYQATAAVKFEQSTQLSGLLVEVLSYSSADSIETQVTIIKSYPIIEDVAKRLGYLKETPTGRRSREAKGYWGTLDSINGKLRVNRVPNTSILEITATSTRPREAQDLANTTAESYRDYNKSLRNSRVTEARRFIENQLKDVEARSRRTEAEIWAFREANRIVAPGAESSVLMSLFTQVRGDIEKARGQRTELESIQQRLAALDTASPTDRVFIETTNPAMQKLQGTLSELQLERNNLAVEVTDRHPRLQALDDKIAEIRSEMRREVSAQIAMLRNREEFLNRQIGELQQKNRELPTLGAFAATAATRGQDQRRSARAPEDQAPGGVDQGGRADRGGLDRTPATEPESPIGGETANTLMIGAVLGLAIGLVLAFVRENLDTSIGTIEDVESYLGVPVLGVVPHIDSRETVQRILERRPALAQIDPEALLSHSLLITHFDPKSPVAEAYRTLRTNIQFARMERSGKVLVVSSPTLQGGQDHDDREPRAHDGSERSEDLADRREHATAVDSPVLRHRARARPVEHPRRQRAVARLHPDGRRHPHGAVRDGRHHGRPRPRQSAHHRGGSGAGQPLRAPVDAGDDRLPAFRARCVRRDPRRHAADPAGDRLGHRRLAGGRCRHRLPGREGRPPGAQAREGARRERRRQGLGRRAERRQDRDRGLRVHAVLHALLRRGDDRRRAQGAAGARAGLRARPLQPWLSRRGRGRRAGQRRRAPTSTASTP
jgi:uncharacterized protein involved in exopolysaccharide biosynthesis